MYSHYEKLEGKLTSSRVCFLNLCYVYMTTRSGFMIFDGCSSDDGCENFKRKKYINFVDHEKTSYVAILCGKDVIGDSILIIFGSFEAHSENFLVFSCTLTFIVIARN